MITKHNYISLVPGEMKTVRIKAAAADLKSDEPLVMVDCWNIGLDSKKSSPGVVPNAEAQVSHWPTTGLSIVKVRVSHE